MPWKWEKKKKIKVIQNMFFSLKFLSKKLICSRNVTYMCIIQTSWFNPLRTIDTEPTGHSNSGWLYWLVPMTGEWSQPSRAQSVTTPIVWQTKSYSSTGVGRDGIIWNAYIHMKITKSLSSLLSYPWTSVNSHCIPFSPTKFEYSTWNVFS